MWYAARERVANHFTPALEVESLLRLYRETVEAFDSHS